MARREKRETKPKGPIEDRAEGPTQVQPSALGRSILLAKGRWATRHASRNSVLLGRDVERRQIRSQSVMCQA